MQIFMCFLQIHKQLLMSAVDETYPYLIQSYSALTFYEEKKDTLFIFPLSPIKISAFFLRL